MIVNSMGEKMRATWTTIGDTDILIETMDDGLDIVGNTQRGRLTETTGITEDVKEPYDEVKSVIRGIASDIGMKLDSVSAVARP